MSIYDKLNKFLLMPAYFSLTNNVILQRLAELQKTQYLPAVQLQEMQFLHLKKLLNHCYKNVPFYRERFDAAGFHPNRFYDLSDLSRIPYLTKRDLQNHRSRLLAQNYPIGALIADASGGSTGKPTSFYKDVLRNQLRSADKMRHDMWCGWEAGQKYVTLWGAQREFEATPPLKTRMVEKYLYRAYGFNAFDISEEKILTYLQELNKIKPAMIVAYANVAYLFSQIIQSRGIDLTELRLRGLISSAETLTTEKRAMIESAFKTKVLNRYGSREVGVVASECLAQEGMHINSENVLVEIQKGGKDTASGEMGEIIVTDLWNYGMPFIRYQMGDVGSRSDRFCSCGRGLPMLQEVTGRVSDFIVDAKGGLVHGEYFTHLFYGVEGVEQFQLIQEDKETVTLKIHPSHNYDPAALEPVIGKIKLCIGGNVQVNLQLFDSSLIEPSGKFRFTVSRISSDRFSSLTPTSSKLNDL